MIKFIGVALLFCVGLAWVFMSINHSDSVACALNALIHMYAAWKLYELKT